jgi:hypothetical protein
MSYAKGDKVLVNGTEGSVFWVGKDKFTGEARLGVKVNHVNSFVAASKVTPAPAAKPRPKFIRYEDMDPAAKARHNELRALMSPRIIAREQIRAAEGDVAADTWYDNSFEADLANAEVAADRAANVP